MKLNTLSSTQTTPINECYVHIGMHKTGSSSIQHNLYRHLSDNHFVYAQMEIPNHSIPIYSMFAEDLSLAISYFRNTLNEDEIIQYNLEKKRMLVENIQNNPGKNFIISGEGITKLRQERGLRDFHRFLSDHFEKITIIGYVRPPISFMESALQQRVKSGTLVKFLPSNLYPNYRQCFEKFDHEFGIDNVILRKYDPNIFPGNDVVLDFCETLDIKINPDSVERFNESLSRDVVCMLYAYNKYHGGFGGRINMPRENTLINNALSEIGSGKIKLSPDVVLPIIDNNKADIEWMERRLGDTLNEAIDVQDKMICSEDDLLKPSAESIQALKKLITPEVSTSNTPVSPIEIAGMIHELRSKLISENNHVSNNKTDHNVSETGELVLNMDQLLKSIRTKNPELINKLSKKQVFNLLSEVFTDINEKINSMESGKIHIPSFGVFIVKNTVNNNTGKSVKRIIFRPK